MQTLPRHTFYTISVQRLQRTMRAEFDVPYDARAGIERFTNDSYVVYYHEQETSKFNRKAVETLLSGDEDVRWNYPDPCSVINFLIEKEIYPAGDYLIEVSW